MPCYGGSPGSKAKRGLGPKTTQDALPLGFGLALPVGGAMGGRPYIVGLGMGNPVLRHERIKGINLDSSLTHEVIEGVAHYLALAASAA